MLKHAVIVFLSLLPVACFVQTETLEGPEGPTGQTGSKGDQGETGSQGLPGVSPFERNPDGSIYYTSGNVGLGTEDPGAALEIQNGACRLSSTAVSQGATDAFPAHAYAQLGPCRDTGGGLCIAGLNDAQATDNAPVHISGILADEALSAPIGQIAAVELWAYRSSGTGVGPLSSNGKALAVRNFNSQATKELVTVMGDGSVGIGIASPGSALDVSGTIRATQDVQPYGYTQTESINVRTIVTKTMANALCPSGAASYVPWKWRGKSGDDICAADVHGAKACTGVKFVFVTAKNDTGSNPQYDQACATPLDYPWPWGIDYADPDTFDGEYFHGDTYVVCCN